MKDSLKYVSGRAYEREHMPKGKARKGPQYVREERDSEGTKK